MQDEYRTDSGITQMWGDYERSVMYQNKLDLNRKFSMFVRFWQGEQWAKPTPKTRNLPRPVVNIVKMFCRNKKSAILSTPVKILYRADTSQVNVQAFNDFSEYIQKEMGMERIDNDALHEGSIKGTYIYHYYWDVEARGKDGIQEGALRCELIDPLNLHVSNPCERDEQKQKWIMIASRESVDSVRAKCDKAVRDEIISDDADYRNDRVEQDGSELCTVLTKYFRQNGEVYCMKATKTAVINKPFPISPDLESAGRELGFCKEEDAPNNALPDRHGAKNLLPERAKATLYPVVVGNYERRENSIYGIGEVEGIIPNQKSINFMLAMALLNVQEVAWGKYVVHPNALKGQSITNEPGQVLIDFSNTGNGIRRMTEQSISTAPTQLVDTLTSLTRVVAGSSEVMTGETLGSSMSGAAIAQLQAQAQQPIDDLKKQFWLVKEKQGKVLAQFFKLYYTEKEYTRDIREGENAKESGLSITASEDKVIEVFKGDAYEGVDFEVVVETTAGTRASAAGDIALLERLHDKGAISTIGMIKAYPKDALANRDEILKALKEEEYNKVSQMQAQLEQTQALAVQLQQQVRECTEIIQKQRETVGKAQSLIRDNNQLKSLLVELYAEARNKIEEGNRQIALGNQRIGDAEADATDFAITLNNMLRDTDGE